MSAATRSFQPPRPRVSNTGNRRREQHLRAPNFFDWEDRPLVRLVAAVAPARGGRLEMTDEAA